MLLTSILIALLAQSALTAPAANCVMFCPDDQATMGFVQPQGFAQAPSFVQPQGFAQPSSFVQPQNYAMQPVQSYAYMAPRTGHQRIFGSGGLGTAGGRLEDFGTVSVSPVYRPMASVVEQKPQAQDMMEAMFFQSSSSSNTASSQGYIRYPVAGRQSSNVQMEPIRRYPAKPCASEYYTDPCVQY